MATKESKMPPKPKRFLTAYNFFFMHERAAYLESQQEDSSLSMKLPTAVNSASDASKKSWTMKSKRKHVKTHGKISFKDLTTHISKKWKQISPEEKRVFEDLAKEDLARYRKELEEYKKIVRDKWEETKRQKRLEESRKAENQDDANKLEAPKSSEEACVHTQENSTQQDVETKDEVYMADQVESTSVASRSYDRAEDVPREEEKMSKDEDYKEDQEAQTKEDDSKEGQVKQPIYEECKKDQDRRTKDEKFDEINTGTTSEDGMPSMSDSTDNNDIESVLAGEIDDLENISLDSDAMDFTVGSFANMSIFSDDPDQNCVNTFEMVYESLSTRILRISDERKDLYSSNESAALKLLTDQFPPTDQISRLQNEYEISQHLSKKCGSVRSALKLVNHEGFHAMYLEWVSGTTMKEWIKTLHTKTQDMETSDQYCNFDTDNHFDIMSAVYVAREVSKALSEIHDCGVVHNNISSDNIMIEKSKDDCCFSVKIIDLGRASSLAEHECIHDDLRSLGAVLFELFVGTNPNEFRYTNTERSCSYSETGESSYSQRLHHELKSRVPLCLSTITFKLMEKRDDYFHYRSIKEVGQDLDIILSDPNYFLNNMMAKNRKCPCNFQTERLYGRDEHLSVLKIAYDRVRRSDSTSEMVIVLGYAGAGKSALVQQMKTSVADHGGIFLSGKFEQLEQMKPFSAIAAAFSNLFKEVGKRRKGEFHQIRTAVQEAVGSETGVLANVIPCLHEIIGTPIAETIKVGGMGAQIRLKYIFRLFIRAIATPAHPLVLFLDDLQWSDPLSLELVKSLITDAESTSLLLIGSYRENEVSATHPLAGTLRQIESKRITITNIKVDNLSKEDTNELIADMVQRPSRSTTSLAEVVYRKTSGNVLFILQFLRSLCDEGLLYFSIQSREWQWELSMLKSQSIVDNAVELISRKILQFPEETQNALKLMACLGSFCEESALHLVASKENGADLEDKRDLGQWQGFHFCYSDLTFSLELAIKEGLMDFVDSKYRFVHDQFRFASYSLIPEKERGSLHLWIGNQVWANRAASPEKALFIAVGQLNNGSMFINDTNQRIHLAELNLQAGEKSVSLAAFAPAAFYLKTGISLLGDTCWLDHYDLCLRLHDAYAEAEYCKGEFQEMDRVFNDICENARCFDDKIRSHFIYVCALGAQNKLPEALKAGLLVLEQMGEPIETSSNTKALTMTEFIKTKQMLNGKTDSDLLELNKMNDSKKIAAVRLMNILALYAYLADQRLYPLLVFRIVQTSLCYGLCNESIFGFSSYGGLLSCVFHDIKGAYRFGQLSLHLLKKLKAKECLSRVYLIIYSLVNSWMESHHASLEPLKFAYESGMRCGDIQYAMMNARQYCAHLYQCGEELLIVEKSCRDYGQKMMEHKQNVFFLYTLPYRQACLNLMGQSNDPLQLTGDAMNQDVLLKDAMDRSELTLVSLIYHQRGWLAYIFGDYVLASEMVEAAKVIDTSTYPPFLLGSYAFLDGLVSIALACRTDDVKWKKLARNALDKMVKYSQIAPSNFQHKLLLLQAEFACLSADRKNASNCYDAAIKTAGENKYVQDQAVAYERAGIFHFNEGDSSRASHYYSQAHIAYLKWGAHCKADHLRFHSPV